MLHFLGTDNTKHLIEDVIDHLGDETISYEIVDYDEFANGETRVLLKKSVRGREVIVIADMLSKWVKVSLNDRYMQFKLILQTAKNHWAESISCVIPCYPYSRQDKPVHAWLKQRSERAPSSAQLIAQEIEALWVEYCITLDVHNPATAMAFDQTKFVDLYTWWFIHEVIHNRMDPRQSIVLSWADQWSDKKISAIAKDLWFPYIIALKTRDTSKKNAVEDIHIYGDITDKHILIHDDMLDTWWTMCRLLKTMKEKNPASISIAITHGMFNGPAFERFDAIYEEWVFDTIYITDTVRHDKLPSYVKVIEISPLLASTLRSIALGKSIKYNGWL